MAGKATRFWAFATVALLGLAAPVLAQPNDAKRAAENRQIEAAARKGPVDIPLRDEAVLHLPAGNVFIPAKEAAILMQRMGNFTNDHFLGLVVPEGDKQDWFVDVSYDDTGYVKDDDGKSIDADDLLSQLKSGTNEENDQRRVKGLAEVEVMGWIEKPHYDQTSHHLVWSLEIRDKGAPASAETGVNYNTYALGRRGYITMDLVTSRSVVAANKSHVQALLAALSFNKGAQYSDFNAKTDKIAEYGLLALIGGVAIKKLGLLALGAAFFLKFLKLIIAALVACWLAVKKFVLGRKGEAQPEMVPDFKASLPTPPAEPAPASSDSPPPSQG